MGNTFLIMSYLLGSALIGGSRNTIGLYGNPPFSPAQGLLPDCFQIADRGFDDYRSIEPADGQPRGRGSWSRWVGVDLAQAAPRQVAHQAGQGGVMLGRNLEQEPAGRLGEQEHEVVRGVVLARDV